MPGKSHPSTSGQAGVGVPTSGGNVVGPEGDKSPKEIRGLRWLTPSASAVENIGEYCGMSNPFRGADATKNPGALAGATGVEHSKKALLRDPLDSAFLALSHPIIATHWGVGR